MKKYIVEQGVMSKSGTGSFDCVVAYCDTLEEAKKVFDSCKEDTRGYHIERKVGEYLETWLTLNDEEQEYPVIDSYVY